MASYEYAFISLNDGLYEEELREKLGTYFDTAVNCFGLRGQDAADIFVASGLAAQFEVQNPRFVAGRSGTELVMWALERCGIPEDVCNPPRVPASADYWVGYHLALFQIATGWLYHHVFERVSYADLREMHAWCQEKSEQEIIDEMRILLERRPTLCGLRRLRNAKGLTQAQLADKVGLSARTIQQYEEGKKDINKAAAVSVYKLSLVLGCRMEDLLEPAGVKS